MLYVYTYMKYTCITVIKVKLHMLHTDVYLGVRDLEKTTVTVSKSIPHMCPDWFTHYIRYKNTSQL